MICAAKIDLAPAFNLDNLFMVANVAAVLWNKGGEVYNLDMAPAVNGTGSCLRFFNFHHELDPFCAVAPFDPPDSWRGVGEAAQQAFQDVPVDKADIQDVNVHSLTHYLSHPAVHVPILRRLAGSSSVVTDAERDAAITRWRADRIKSKAKLDAWKQRYATWQAAHSANWLDELNMLVDWRSQILPFVNRDGES